jgi:hypothetical protein
MGYIVSTQQKNQIMKMSGRITVQNVNKQVILNA